MATYNKFNQFTNDLCIARHNFSTGVYKIMLLNTAPSITAQTRADVASTELATGAGYTSGGATVTVTVASSSGVAKVSGANIVFTASGGSIGPFQYAVLYNATSGTTSQQYLISWFDYGSAITLAATETLTVVFDAVNGILQIS
ncbi:MAG: hypothetical protein KGL39_55240 [Patescibacteria group bacterium]|nr:hypothetical protein [Patescibacteria group bacterium]